jgi:Zn-finger nucleic acid-binding protein
MALEPSSVVQQVEEQQDSHTYRCPGCGEWVDNREMKQVLAHHQHVIFRSYPPAWFSSPANRTHSGAAEPRPQQRKVQVQPNERRGAEKRARRYGH